MPDTTFRCAVLALGLSACHHAASPPSPALPSPASPREDPHVVAVTRSLLPVVQVKGAPPVRYRLEERMRRFAVPGVSIAVADGGRIVWARGFGVRQAGAAEPILPTTPFEAASISKVLAATATLRQVEKGALSLDEDVNHYLRSWKVPESSFTAKEKVTLRRILSHSAGLTNHSVPSYDPGEPVPTLLQALAGEKPAKDEPVRVDVVPGTVFRYSGGGVSIEQLLLTEVTGQPFPALLAREVLDPIGMRDSSFASPPPVELSARAALPHDAAGKRRPLQRYVQLAAAGLWSTPTDLLKWALEIDAARAGRSTRVLGQAMAQQMLAVQMKPFGLGPLLHGSGRALRFGHPGWNEGFHAELVYFPETGQGAAVMLNGDGGRAMVREILYAIAAEYGWPDPEFAPDTIEVLAADEPALARVVGTYEVAQPNAVTATVVREGKRLFLEAPVLGPRSELVFTSPTVLTMLETGDDLSIVSDARGQVTALDFGFLRLARRPPGK